jgi:hypothetical protein
MEIKEIQNKKKEVVTDILCDICGVSCKKREDIVQNERNLDNGQPYYSFEFMELKANWGYESGKDCEEWSAQICEKCVDEKLNFIKFHKHDYL